MLRAFDGRVALVTGARRVAHSIVLRLAREGAAVAFTYHRSAGAASTLKRSVEGHGGQVLAIEADLAHAQGCAEVIAAVIGAWGRLDVLVSVASRYDKRPLAALDAATFTADLAVDLDATLWCAHAAMPHMRRQGFGRIVNITDWTAEQRRPRYPGFLGYYVAKSSAIALTEALALEAEGAGVLVNGVAAGPIEPPESSPDSFIEEARAAIPLGRWGGGASIADAVVALVAQDFVTGETLRVDGGRALR